jgi:hypothetical protein
MKVVDSGDNNDASREVYTNLARTLYLFVGMRQESVGPNLHYLHTE